MMKLSKQRAFLAALAMMTLGEGAFAATSAEEAAQLKTTLTPFGAERAANKDGSIPSWDGGLTKPLANLKSGDALPDLFADEKPKFSVTPTNMDQYEDKLSEGAKGLLKKYPKTFRIDVYPTHRTASAPQWVYDNTAKNAVRAQLTEEGRITGAYGGIPFPIPKNGLEAMWNHKLQWAGEATAGNYLSYFGLANGQVVRGSEANNLIVNPYYFKDGSLEKFDGVYTKWLVGITGPAHKAGEQFLVYDAINQSRQAWQYLTGQRRVRKAPSICCDAPEEVNSGIDYWDEAFGFWGDLDQYDWKLVGKKEMFIPYNGNKLQAKLTQAQVALPHHLNPDYVRWELHRVWVVEASLKKGMRHVVPKRTFYLDEDTWAAVLNEGYDAQGTLWRVGVSVPMILPEGPLVHGNNQWSVYNLLGGVYLSATLSDWTNPNYKFHQRIIDRTKVPLTRFTPDAMAGEGAR